MTGVIIISDTRAYLVDKLSEVIVDGFWSFLSSATSAMPASANTACAAATERLNRLVAGTSTLRVHWKGRLSLSGAQMVAGEYSEA